MKSDVAIPNFYAIQPVDHTGDKKNTVLPMEHPFTQALISVRNGGKSTTIVNLVTRIYAGKFDRIFILSPSFMGDAKMVNMLKKKGIRKVHRNEKTEQEKEEDRILLRPPEQKKKDDGRIHEEDVITEDFEEALKEIIQMKQSMNDNTKRWWVICDDLASSGLLRQDKSFLWFLLNARHINVALTYTSQTYTSISPAVRLNTEVFFLYSFSSKREIERFYNEHSCGLDRETWEQMYEMVKKSSPYAFLSINYTAKDRDYMLTNSLRKFIRFTDDD